MQEVRNHPALFTRSEVLIAQLILRFEVLAGLRRSSPLL
jgi:hypothetical protein